MYEYTNVETYKEKIVYLTNNYEYIVNRGDTYNGIILFNNSTDLT